VFVIGDYQIVVAQRVSPSIERKKLFVFLREPDVPRRYTNVGNGVGFSDLVGTRPLEDLLADSLDVAFKHGDEVAKAEVLGDGPDGVKEEILLHEPQGFSAALFGQIEALLDGPSVSAGD
jgi:hypothetical protein